MRKLPRKLKKKLKSKVHTIHDFTKLAFKSLPKTIKLEVKESLEKLSI